MKDDMGNGYQSWKDKMVETVRNVIKHDCKCLPSSDISSSEPSKRSKLSPENRKKAAKIYPAGAQYDDVASTESHMSVITLSLLR
jgi:hypothetical protein